MPTRIRYEEGRLKTYVNERTLEKAIEAFPAELRYIVCRTPEGRVYPVFTNTQSLGMSGQVAHSGFLIVG